MTRTDETTMDRDYRTIIAVTVYWAAIVVANLTIAAFGPSWTIINAFLLIGLDLSLRDRLHDSWRGNGLLWRMAALIGFGGLLSWWLNPAAGPIAVASTVAFTAAATADAAVYHAARRWTWMARANISNVVGAAVDSLVFPTLAFGGFMWGITAGQWTAKVAGGFLWALAIAAVRNRASEPDKEPA